MNTETLLVISASLFSLIAVLISLSVLRKSYDKAKSFRPSPGNMISPQREFVENKVLTSSEPLTKDLGFLTDSNHLLLDVSANKDMIIRTKLPDFSFFEEMAINLPDVKIDERMVACLMPFNHKFDSIKRAISDVCTNLGYSFRRSDDILVENNTDLRKSIVRMILEAQIVIAVLDGRNPNVYYEIGIAHSMGKLVLLLANLNREDTAKVPVDMLSNRLITYNGIEDLKSRLTKTIQAIHYAD